MRATFLTTIISGSSISVTWSFSCPPPKEQNQRSQHPRNIIPNDDTKRGEPHSQSRQLHGRRKAVRRRRHAERWCHCQRQVQFSLSPAAARLRRCGYGIRQVSIGWRGVYGLLRATHFSHRTDEKLRRTTSNNRQCGWGV